MARQVVHHFVANRVTHRQGTTSNLLGVDYEFAVPADTEFPRTLAQLDLFTRFFPHRAAVMTFQLAVRWLEPPTPPEPIVHTSRLFALSFPAADVVEHVFRLASIQLPGVGRYEIRLRRRGTRWGRPAWGLIGREYFRVVRQP